MSSIPRPDLSARPLQMTCEYTVNAKPSEVYAAWTEGSRPGSPKLERFCRYRSRGDHTSSTTEINGAGIPTMAASSK